MMNVVPISAYNTQWRFHLEDLRTRRWRRCFPTRGLLLGFLALFAAGCLVGDLGPAEWDWIRGSLLLVTTLALALVWAAPDHFLEEHLWRHVFVRRLPALFLWTTGALAATELLSSRLSLQSLPESGEWLLLGVACLVGLLPESGPHLVFVTPYAQGSLPLSVLLATCHDTASGPGASADWIYYMERAIRGVFGEEIIVVFAPGFSGDVTQVDNLSPYQRESGDEQSRYVGGNVGAEAVRAMLTMHRGECQPVGSAYEILRLPRRRPSPQKVQRAYEIVRKNPEEVGQTEWMFAKETVMLDALLQKEPAVDAEVQVIQIGPAVFAGAGGEIFCEFGLRLKRESPFPFTFPVSFANTSVGYVPDRAGPGKERRRLQDAPGKLHEPSSYRRDANRRRPRVDDGCDAARRSARASARSALHARPHRNWVTPLVVRQSTAGAPMRRLALLLLLALGGLPAADLPPTSIRS